MELLSNCCTANHDGRFHFDDETDTGVCVQCKEHAEFIKYDEECDVCQGEDVGAYVNDEGNCWKCNREDE